MILITMLFVSSATAQSRGATIGVAVTVRGLKDADVIGAGALARSDARPAAHVVSGSVLESGSWRISSGGNPEIGLHVEALDGGTDGSAPYVAVCDEDGGDGTCWSERCPTLHMRSGTAETYVVRVGWNTKERRDAGGQRPVRLTVAYTAI